MLSPDQIITSLEFGTHQTLTEEDRAAIQQYYNGRSLQQLVFMPGWEVLMNAFEEHKKSAIDELLGINPGNKDLVLAAHATAYAVHKTLDNLKYEVESAIKNSERLPEVMQESLSASQPTNTI